jgi:hypothetical protein
MLTTNQDSEAGGCYQPHEATAQVGRRGDEAILRIGKQKLNTFCTDLRLPEDREEHYMKRQKLGIRLQMEKHSLCLPNPNTTIFIPRHKILPTSTFLHDRHFGIEPIDAYVLSMGSGFNGEDFRKRALRDSARG